MSRFLDKFLNVKWLFYIMIFITYSFHIKDNLLFQALQYEVGINFFDVFFTIISDPYLLLFLTFPFILFSCYREISLYGGHSYLIRFRQPLEWALYMTRKIKFCWIIPLFYGTVAAIMISLPYKLQFFWSEYSMVNLYSDSVTYNLSQNFSNPIMAMLLHYILFSLFCYGLSFFLTTLYILFRQTTSLAIGAVSIFIFSNIGFKFFSYSAFSKYSIVNYCLLYLSTEFIGHFFHTLFIIALFMLFVISLYKIKLINLLNFKKIFILLMFIFIVWGISDKSASSLEEYIIHLFYGVPSEGTTFIQFLFYIILHLGFLFYIGSEWQDYLINRVYYEFIRYKTLWTWFFSLLKVWISKTLIYFSMILIISILLYLIQYKTFLPLCNLTVKTIIYFIVVSVFQMIIYLLFNFIFLWLTGSLTSLIICNSILSILIFLHININGITIFGQNSLGYFYTNQNSLSIVVIFLSLVIGILLGFIRIMLKIVNPKF